MPSPKPATAKAVPAVKAAKKPPTAAELKAQVAKIDAGAFAGKPPPKAAVKPPTVKPPKPKRGAKPAPAEDADTSAPVKFPEYEVNIHTRRTGEGYNPPMTCDRMKFILGWETAAEFRARMVEDNPALEDAAKLLVTWPDGRPANPLLTLPDDLGGQDVYCWNVRGNRPYDLGDAMKIAQDHLNKKWRMNLESLVVNERGFVDQGQHRGTGFVIACMRWAGPEKDHWREFWPEEPTMECVVAFGAEDAQEVRATYDNTRSRTLADTLYTSDLFPGVVGQDRRRICVTLDRAVDTLWKRTHAGKEGEDRYNMYQTHSTSQEFLKRHLTLVRCVEKLTELNAGSREIGKLDISPGWAAAMCYLMASSATDGDDYANGGRDEKALNLDNLDAALAFWAAVAALDRPAGEEDAGPDGYLVGEPSPLRKALAKLADTSAAEVGASRALERSCLVCLAWKLYLEGGEEAWTADALALPYFIDDKTGEPAVPRELTEVILIDGIDQGEGKFKAKEPTVTPAAAEDERERIAAELAAEVETTAPAPQGIAKEVADLKAANPGRLLLFPDGRRGGSTRAYADDAAAVARSSGDKVKGNQDGVPVLSFFTSLLDHYCEKLVKKGYVPALVTINGQEAAVADWEPTPEDGPDEDDTDSEETNGDGYPPAGYTKPTRALPRPLNRR